MVCIGFQCDPLMCHRTDSGRFELTSRTFYFIEHSITPEEGVDVPARLTPARKTRAWMGRIAVLKGVSLPHPLIVLSWRTGVRWGGKVEGGGQSKPLDHFSLLLWETTQSHRKRLTIGLATKGCAFTRVSFETGSSCCHSLSLKLLMPDFLH